MYSRLSTCSGGQYICTTDDTSSDHQSKFWKAVRKLSVKLTPQATGNILYFMQLLLRLTLYSLCAFFVVYIVRYMVPRFYKNLEHIFIWRIITINVFFIIASLARSLFCWIWNLWWGGWGNWEGWISINRFSKNFFRKIRKYPSS